MKLAQLIPLLIAILPAQETSAATKSKDWIEIGSYPVHEKLLEATAAVPYLSVVPPKNPVPFEVVS